MSSKEVAKILDYLGASKGSVNVGTKIKLQILEKVLNSCIGKKDITYNSLVSLLSLRCNVTPRTMKEGYIEPLIDVGILKLENNMITYIGLYIGLGEPEEIEEDLSDEEKKKILEEALK